MFLDSINIEQPDHWLVSWQFEGEEFEAQFLGSALSSASWLLSLPSNEG